MPEHRIYSTRFGAFIRTTSRRPRLRCRQRSVSEGVGLDLFGAEAAVGVFHQDLDAAFGVC